MIHGFLSSLAAYPDIDAVVNAANAAASIATHPEEIFGLRGLARALGGVRDARTVADKAVLLREALRLAGGSLRLPRAGAAWDENELDHLGRFGIVRSAEGGIIHFVLGEWPAPGLPEQLTRDIVTALELDELPRRQRSPECPDGALVRLSSHRSYSTSTQKAAARALLTMPAGASMLVVMPTGSGKSLLFQMGIRWWRERSIDEVAVGVVIVPTVALALEHRKTLRRMPGLERSEALIGSVDAGAREDILLRFRRGEIPLLIMAPEMAFSVREELVRTAKPCVERYDAERGHVVGIFIDEVHIIETWGRSFRPDFQRLPSLIERLREGSPELRIVLLSATVGDTTRELLAQQYGPNGLLTVAAQCARTEFDFVTDHFHTRESRDEAALTLLDALPRPAIVYTTEVAHAEAIGEGLAQRGYQRFEVFTGDTSSNDRERIIEAWSADTIDLVVATSAFGMGIDKANVRAIVHVCLPENAARYYQEIGRAARDGHQALALLLRCDDDARVGRGLATGQLLTEEVSAPRWRAIVAACRASGALGYEETTRARPLLDVDLNTAWHRVGKHPGRHNRRWNASLLNQMQRAGALEVLAVDERSDHWNVAVNDASLLDEGPDATAHLSAVLAMRDEEMQIAGKAFLKFLACIEETEVGDGCLLEEVYRLVEGLPVDIDLCGRCPGCRRHRTRPVMSAVKKGGQDVTWQRSGSTRRLAFHGVHVLVRESTGDEGASSLLLRLAATGIEQFIVPDRMMYAAAETLAGIACNPGIVLGLSHVARRGWAVDRVPTAVLLDQRSPTEGFDLALLDRLRKVFQGCNDAFLMLAAPSDLRLAGKYLSQMASTSPPLHEAQLARVPAR